MKKLCLLIVVMIGCVGLSMGQAASSDPKAGETVTFRFLPQDDGFYLTVHKNNDEFMRLLDLVTEYRNEITSGEMPLHVTSYSSALATTKANLASAKIRANRVKSELIVRRGLVENNFKTVNKVGKYEGQPSVVVVKMTIPKSRTAVDVKVDEAKEAKAAEVEAQEKIKEAEFRAREAELKAREAELKAREAELKAREAEARAAAKVETKELKAKKKKDQKIEKEAAKLQAKEEAAAARAAELQARAEAKEAAARAKAEAKALEDAKEAVPVVTGDVKKETSQPQVTTVKTLKEIDPEEKVVIRPDVFVKPDKNREEYEPVISKTWGKPYKYAVRTNMLYWAAAVPNVGVDIRFSGSTALVVNGAWTHVNWKSDRRTYRLAMINPEFRWYLGTCKNWYTGVGANYGEFNFKFKHTGYQGNFYGGGLLVGYQTNLARNLFLDFNLGLGYLYSEYDSYTMNEHKDRCAKERDKVMHYVGPTQAGISLVWTIGQPKK